MSISKKSIGKSVSGKLGSSSLDAEIFVNFFIKILKKNLNEGKKIKLTGFGTFSCYDTPQRIGRNPKTKKTYIIERRTKVKLEISNKLKRYLN
jgi:integration host factor subunit alpha